MENYVNSVRKAIEAENWYAALFVSLSLPEICGATQYPKKGNGERYKEWFDKYLSGLYSTKLTAHECWLLRCSYFHEGRDDSNKSIYDGIVFLDSGNNQKFHLHKIGIQKDWEREILVLDIAMFCEHICQGVEKWVKDTKEIKDVCNRSKMLLKVEKMRIEGNSLIIPVPIRVNKY